MRVAVKKYAPESEETDKLKHIDVHIDMIARIRVRYRELGQSLSMYGTRRESL